MIFQTPPMSFEEDAALVRIEELSAFVRFARQNVRPGVGKRCVWLAAVARTVAYLPATRVRLVPTSAVLFVRFIIWRFKTSENTHRPILNEGHSTYPLAPTPKPCLTTASSGAA